MEERYKLVETDVDCSEKDLARIVFLSARLRDLLRYHLGGVVPPNGIAGLEGYQNHRRKIYHRVKRT